ncbi:MAG: undecaprenyl/decaprenyl-phosphate alpha-N-acetylglucosaminyl 1-phosphate transferase, partial [Phocaeicola sp.]|nr:undecaprenyl/decaprenyl-phosphate alpha-N-acetylglucosaminyl 1-phosphate transferase [Phocaeicola sp.]
FVLAFSPLIIPCFDVVRVFFHRIRRGHSPFLPDKNHLHHKMLAMGMEQHPVMITILSMAAALIVVNLILSAFIEITILLVLNMIFWLIFIFYLNYRIHQYNLKKNIPDSED